MNFDKYKEQFNNIKQEAINPSKTNYSRKKLLFQWIAILAVILVLYFAFSAFTKSLDNSSPIKNVFKSNVITLKDNSTITIEE